MFLDIDGVLAPIRQWDRYGDLDPACIRVLNEIVADGDADVVVSSTWRYGKTVAELQEMLDAEGFIGTVIDKTPIGGARRRPGRGDRRLARGACRGRLRDHRRPRDMGELRTHLVLTQPARGLQPADAPRAIAVLDATAQRRAAMLIVRAGRGRQRARRRGRTPAPCRIA